MPKDMKDMKSFAKNLSEEVAPSKEPYYPSMRVSAKSVPKLKNATIDSTGYMIVEYRVKEISQYGNGDIEINLDIEKGAIYDKEK